MHNFYRHIRSIPCITGHHLIVAADQRDKTHKRSGYADAELLKAKGEPVRKKIVVMQLQHDPSGEDVVLNPYLKLLTDSLPPERVFTRWFRWTGLLTDSFDILHVHWPEFYIRHRTLPGHLLKSALFAIFLMRVRVMNKHIVRTVHNLKPHESGGWIERRLLEWVDRMTTTWIVMNESTPTPDPTRTVIIPHGHYRGWYEIPEGVTPRPGEMLVFGRVRAYKGIDELVRAFVQVDSIDGLSLRIMGKSDGPETEQVLADIKSGDRRVELDFRFVPDNELASAIAACELVVLPYRDILNSGSALLALSLNRPVLMRETPSTKLLQDEFGAEWVRLFAGGLTPKVLEHALEGNRRGATGGVVDMSRREWNVIGEQLAAAYEADLAS